MSVEETTRQITKPDGERVELVPVHSLPARAPRQRWFSASPTGTLAVLSGTCSGIGLGSLGLERLAAWVTQRDSLGAMLELPIPYISAPLGLGAVFTALLVARSSPRLALGPAALAASYWALAWWMWP